MKKIIALCIGLLFLLTAGCGGGGAKVSANTPEAAVKGYFENLEKGKPDLAYQYRKFDPPKSKDDFVKEQTGRSMSFKDFTVGKAEVKDKTATVPVKFKTGVAAMPELTMNVVLEKGENWQIISLGMGGGAPSGASDGSGTGEAPAGMPPAGMGGTVPSGENPHAPGGSVPLDK